MFVEVMNPFNRVPETEESLALACHCICSSGSAGAKSSGSSESDECGCQCYSVTGGNKESNDYKALTY